MSSLRSQCGNFLPICRFGLPECEGIGGMSDVQFAAATRRLCAATISARVQMGEHSCIDRSYIRDPHTEPMLLLQSRIFRRLHPHHPRLSKLESFLSDLPALGGGLDDEGSDVGDVVVREAAAEGGHGTLAVGDLGHDGLLVEATGEELQRFCGQLQVHVQETRKGPGVLRRVDQGMDLDEIPTVEHSSRMVPRPLLCGQPSVKYPGPKA